MSKKIPFSKNFINAVVGYGFSTPFYVYDEEGIRKQAKLLNAAFAWNKQYKNFYAVKACPNPAILRILKKEGMGADCSSLPELILSQDKKFGVCLPGSDIMFTSNNTQASEFVEAYKRGAILNLDDITHLDVLEELEIIPETICFRFNPGSAKVGNNIIGDPVDAKYGLTREQLFEAYVRAKSLGVKKFGIHTMVASNELTNSYFADTADLLFKFVAELYTKEKIEISFVNLGGGFGIPYKPSDIALDIMFIGKEIEKLYNEYFESLSLKPAIFTESGRYVTGPHGYLVTTVINFKDIYKLYVGVDATMADLMRPGMYGAYHEIVLLGHEDVGGGLEAVDVVGSLCENCDKFAIDRDLPVTKKGDILVICDVGAHGRAMGFNYNGKLRCGEILFNFDGSFEIIRRAENIDDLFATL